MASRTRTSTTSGTSTGREPTGLTEPAAWDPGVAGAVAEAGRLSLGEAAAGYAAAGLAVFPCAPGAKRPWTRHGLADATADLERIGWWWRQSPQANVGLVTGRPGSFDVLDVDVHPGGSGFPALRRARQAGLVEGWAAVVRTPSGGLHLYFPAAGLGHEQGSWAVQRAHVDFRGLGGYVLVPPSRIAAARGGERGYRLLATGRDPRPVDGRAVRRLVEPPPRRPDPRRMLGRDTRRSGERLEAWVADQAEGNRNRALFWAACRQAEAGIPEGDARLLLGSAAARAGLEAREIGATVASAYRTATARRLVEPGAITTGWLER